MHSLTWQWLSPLEMYRILHTKWYTWDLKCSEGTSIFEVSMLWRSNIIYVSLRTRAIQHDAPFSRSLGYLITRLNPVQQIGSTAGVRAASWETSQKSSLEKIGETSCQKAREIGQASTLTTACIARVQPFQLFVHFGRPNCTFRNQKHAKN